MKRNKFDGFLSRDREGWDGICAARFCSVGAAVAAVGVVSSMSAADDAASQQDAALAQQGASADRTYALAAKQDARADEQWQRYKQIYQPLEDQMIDESRGLGSIANQNKAASDAAAGVSSSFGRARERLAKNPGVNPSSQQYQQEVSKIGLQEAATSAAAQTGAREAVKDRGTAAMTNAVSLGKGLPASANAGAASAGALAGAAGGIYSSIASSARQQGADAGANSYGIGKLANGIFNSAPVQSWLNSPSGSSGGFGSVPGGYTSGGTTYNNPSAYSA